MSVKAELAQWGKNWFNEKFSDETRRLVFFAQQDLYNGPSGLDENYPGFETACQKIREELSHVPSALWIDIYSETVSEVEPEWCNHESGHEVEQDDVVKAIECDGHSPNDWQLIERAQIIRTIVGKELAQYV